ncbi:MAG: rod shape-determining protein MreC [Candidatus Acidiferrales bacterium]
MHAIISRRRPLTLLAGVVLAQIFLLAFQIKRNRDVRLIRYWAVQVTSPVERAGTWIFSRVGALWGGYVALHNTRAENQSLRRELDRLRLRNAELESQAAEGQRLAALLDFREAHPEAPMLAAQVIGASADPVSHTLFINRGERDHVRRNMAVITPDGVVGKIVEVFPATAQVLLINDKDSGVGVLFAETRTHGVVKGTGDILPRMDYVVNTENVHAGETILTSGEDRIFPKGLLVGTVADAAPGNPFQTIHIEPAVRLDRLEDVLVLLSLDELAPEKTEAPPAAAEAQPTSPAQPAAVPSRNPSVAPPKPSSGKPVTDTPASARAPH